MTFKERLESNPIHYLLGAVVVAFTTGFSAYDVLLRVSNREAVDREVLQRLRNSETVAAQREAIAAQREKDLDACRSALVPAAAAQTAKPDEQRQRRSSEESVADEGMASKNESVTETDCPSIDGVWKRNIDGATVDVKQARCTVTFFSEGTQHTHVMRGEYEAGLFRVSTVRRNVETACETRLFGYLKVLDSKHFQAVVESTDGKCDLPKGFEEDFVWTRV
ncbi:MAG TPA: hypothetical protein VEK79_22555 [Thermoanaerobaculia bacterium]|nr:hypothetical protein [Thermoanaerobaculia bacterium]